MTTASHDDVAALAARSEELGARARRRGGRAFRRQVSLACSFQKEETVLLDLLFAVEPKARVFAIDTHYLFPETYELWREVEQRYDTKIEVFEGPSAEELTATHGEKLWERNPDLYLAVAKLAPLARALGDLDCWITGVRRDQSPTRTRRSSAGTPRTSSGRRTRSPTGATTTAGRTSASAGSLQPAARPGLRVDRRHPFDDPGRGPRRPLGRNGQDRVRPAHVISAPVEISPISTSSRRRRSTSCASSPPSSSAPCSSSPAARTRSCCFASPRRRSGRASSPSRSCTSTRATTSPR